MYHRVDPGLEFFYRCEILIIILIKWEVFNCRKLCQAGGDTVTAFKILKDLEYSTQRVLSRVKFKMRKY